MSTASFRAASHRQFLHARIAANLHRLYRRSLHSMTAFGWEPAKVLMDMIAKERLAGTDLDSGPAAWMGIARGSPGLRPIE